MGNQRVGIMGSGGRQCFDHHDTKARYQLAMAYLKLGQTEAGQREMDARDASTKLHEQFYAAAKQAAADPANVQIREQLASIATALGKREVAQRCRGQALPLDHGQARERREREGRLPRLRHGGRLRLCISVARLENVNVFQRR